MDRTLGVLTVGAGLCSGALFLVATFIALDGDRARPEGDGLTEPRVKSEGLAVQLDNPGGPEPITLEGAVGTTPGGGVGEGGVREPNAPSPSPGVAEIAGLSIPTPAGISFSEAMPFGPSGGPRTRNWVFEYFDTTGLSQLGIDEHGVILLSRILPQHVEIFEPILLALEQRQSPQQP